MNRINGPGIQFRDNNINIGYFKNGDLAPGNHIYIIGDGETFKVSQCYIDKKGETNWKGTEYFPDGTSNEYEL